MAQRFDVTRLQLTGAPVIVAGHVSPPHQATGAVISAAADGLLAYGGGGNAAQLIWYSRTGQRLGAIDTPIALHNPTLSPDQEELLTQSQEWEGGGVWVINLANGVAPARAVDDGNVPIWSTRWRSGCLHVRALGGRGRYLHQIGGWAQRGHPVAARYGDEESVRLVDRRKVPRLYELESSQQSGSVAVADLR
jgi:hypothetical protein